MRETGRANRVAVLSRDKTDSDVNRPWETGIKVKS